VRHGRIVVCGAAGHGEVGHFLVEVVVLLVVGYRVCFEGLEQVEQFGMAADVVAHAESKAFCRVDDAVPEVEEVYIIEFGGIDLLVDGAGELAGCFARVDRVA